MHEPMTGIVTKDEATSDLRHALELADKLTQENAALKVELAKLRTERRLAKLEALGFGDAAEFARNPKSE